MSTLETRRINQSTYTPIVNSKDVGDDIPGFVPEQPFLKQSLLTIAFDDPTYCQFLLENTEGISEPLKAAAEEMWKGDYAAVATLLNGVKLDEIAASIRKVLDEEKKLIDDARQNLEKSVSAVVEEEHVESVVTDIENFLDQAEDSIVSLVQENTTVVQNVHQAFTDARNEIIALIERHGTGKQTVDQVKTIIDLVQSSIVSVATQENINPDKIEQVKEETDALRRLLAIPAARSAITFARIPSNLAKNAPQSANFLSALGAPMINNHKNMRLHRLQRTSIPGTYSTGGTVAEVQEGFGKWYEEEAQIADNYEELLDAQDTTNQKKEKALEAVLETMRIEPVGYLHLERLQFTPVDYERGELVYSLPMLPGETVRLSHREWSRTETDYTKLVATSLETATEDAISEKSELAQSSKTEEQYTSAFNASVSASGSYGPVQISTSVGYNCQNSATRSAEFSARHALEITKKAASRSTEEHKISFRITTQYEVEEESYREITNPLDRAVRWDFHRLMKKWQIDLYRYDVRLTYDVVVPEPGSYLLRKYIRLKALNDLLAQPNPFNLSPSNITPDPATLDRLMQQYDVSLEPIPPEKVYITAKGEQTYPGKEHQSTSHYLEIELPVGYEFYRWNAQGTSVYRSEGGQRVATVDVMKSNNDILLTNVIGKASNKYFWNYGCMWGWGTELLPESGTSVSINVWVEGKRSDRLLREWQMKCYQLLSDAARAQFENTQQRLKKLRDELLADLNREDALMLRKLEKEEIMKNVLRWVLGPAFSFYPAGLPALSVQSDELEYYEQATALVRGFRDWEDALVSGGVKQEYYSRYLQFGEIIRFLHQAIEWENVNYVLYPYFWTDDTRWDFKQFLYHNDYVHRSFLRAGAARVVMTIRPGFEKAFLSFMETGKLGELLAPDHPYMTVAEELKAMAQTNYPYTPGADEENPDNRVDTWYEFTPTGALDVMEGTD